MSKSLMALVSAFGLLLAGCTSSGGHPNISETQTKLDRANFRVVKANARGEDSGFYLLGFIPLVSPSVTDAMDRVRAGVESEGRAISLSNMTQERKTTYLVLFSIPRVVVRADVVEFIDEPVAQASRPKTGQSPAKIAPAAPKR